MKIILHQVTFVHLEVAVYDGCLTMVQPRHGLASITEYADHLGLGETRA